MSQKVKDEFDQPLAGDQTSGEPNQGRRQWSMSTLYAARPNPKFDNRAKVIAWNNRYAKNEKLQVNPAEFAETIPDISPEQVEANWDRLRRLSTEKPGLKVIDIWDRPE